MKLKCNRCDHEWTTNRQFKPRLCNMCSSPNWMRPKMEIKDIHRDVSCNQCGNEWTTRSKYGPERCPKCISRLWNKPKRERIAIERECRQCGHQWVSRKETVKGCPNQDCRSKRWNK